MFSLHQGTEGGGDLHRKHPFSQARAVGQKRGGGLVARNVDQIRLEFLLYDVTDTLSMKRRLDYNYVGLCGLCFVFFCLKKKIDTYNNM